MQMEKSIDIRKQARSALIRSSAFQRLIIIAVIRVSDYLCHRICSAFPIRIVYHYLCPDGHLLVGLCIVFLCRSYFLACVGLV